MEGAEHVDKSRSLAGVRVVGGGWVFSVAEWQGRVSLRWEASGVQVCVIPSWVSTAVRVTLEHTQQPGHCYIIKTQQNNFYIMSHTV